MSKPNLNALHGVYRLDPSSNNLDALLNVLRLKALRILRDEDLAQAFLVSFWRRLAFLNGIRDLDTWTNIRLRWHRLSSERARTHHDVLLQDMVAPDLLDLESITDPIVGRAADYILQGYSQQQCADFLGLSPAALRKRLQRYRRSTSK